jgi:predicted enzyme related to lactoylglutathione lyase
MIQPRAVDFVLYPVSDIARAVAFYRDVLGLTVTFHRPLAGFSLFPWAELSVGSTTVATVALVGTSGAPKAEVDLSSPWPEHRWTAEQPDYLAPPSRDQQGGATVALAVENVAATVEMLRGKGVRVVMEPVEAPHCFLAIVADPDGNHIGLHQRKNGTFG